MTVDVVVNGIKHEDAKFTLSPGATVQDLIDVAFAEFGKNSSNRTINSVMIFNKDYEEWERVEIPYNEKPAEHDYKYSLSISCTGSSKKCSVKCIETRKKAATKPTKRANATMKCPQSMKGNFCSKEKHDWFCYDCQEKIQYDFNHNFLCDCGYAPINAFQFRCSDPNHGYDFIGFDDKYLTSLVDQIEPCKEINILILGETGVSRLFPCSI